MNIFTAAIFAPALLLSLTQITLAAELSLAEKLTLSTVRIETSLADGSGRRGSGFFYNFLIQSNGEAVPAIVTNKHVVKGAVSGQTVLNRADTTGEYLLGSFETVKLPNEARWVFHPDPNIDLAILLIGGFLDEQAKQGKRFYFAALDDTLVPTDADYKDLTAIEDIVMIGYPDGIWDGRNNRPIVRRGITATQASLDYEGKKEFLIDAACFPGSSGSPIFLLNQGSHPGRNGGLAIGDRLKFLGVLYAGPQYVTVGDVRTVPMADRVVAVSAIPNNLGNVIKAQQLKAFEPLLMAMQAKMKEKTKR